MRVMAAAGGDVARVERQRKWMNNRYCRCPKPINVLLRLLFFSHCGVAMKVHPRGIEFARPCCAQLSATLSTEHSAHQFEACELKRPRLHLLPQLMAVEYVERCLPNDAKRLENLPKELPLSAVTTFHGPFGGAARVYVWRSRRVMPELGVGVEALHFGDDSLYFTIPYVSKELTTETFQSHLIM